MESHPIPTKRPRIFAEESTVDQSQAELEASPQKRWLCNELVHELCKEISTVKTSDQILLTAYKMYAYLAPGFSRKKLIYRDAIAFLKVMMKAEKNIEIDIEGMTPNNQSDPIVVIRQEQSNDEFKLESNQFRIHIKNAIFFRNVINIYGQLKWSHLLYFLRLIAPLLQPILMNMSSSIPISELAHFLNTQNDWIDSIRLWDHHLKWDPICGALSKYNKLQIFGSLISPSSVPKLVQWLTSNNSNNNNNNGQPKKHLFIRWYRLYDGPARLIDELKKEFTCATSTSRFVLRIEFYKEQLHEFTAFNELTREKLQLCRTGFKDGRNFYALSRSPNDEMDNIERDFAEFDPDRVATISLCDCICIINI